MTPQKRFALRTKKGENGGVISVVMDTQALLLCAGQSSRMWPLSDKIFFEYLGKTVFEHQVDRLLMAKMFTMIHIVGNSQNLERLKEIVAARYPSQKNIFTFSLQENVAEGMLGGVLAAAPNILLQQSLFIMSSNDIVEKGFFQNLRRELQKLNTPLVVCGKKVENYFPGGYLVLDSEKNVEKIIEKPGVGKEPSDFINLVFHFFRQPEKLLQVLQKLHKSASGADGYEAGLQKLFDQGEKAAVLPYRGFWQALKYPWHHLDLMNFFFREISSSKIHKSAQLSPNVQIKGAVWIEQDVRIGEYVVLQGPLYIGRGSIIGDHVLVRDSSVGENCVIGQGSEVARSYLKARVRAHRNYIGDSVIDENVSFGAGTVTGNLRLDEEEIFVQIKEEKVATWRNKLGIFCGSGVRVGINNSLMPGVKLGRGSFIGAGIVLSEDIVENTFLTQKEFLEKKENKKNIFSH